LRPHCAAGDRLRLWHPVPSPNACPSTHELSDAELSRVLDVLSNSWAPGTRVTYGAGLLLWHSHCDSKVPRVMEAHRGPASEGLLLDFLSRYAGVYSGSTLKNYFYGIRAWHILHGLPWVMFENRMMAALAAVEHLEPESSKRAAREPFTPADIIKIREQLDLSSPLDAAVYACLTTTFWSASRVGEFTVPNLKAFDPRLHVKRSDVRRSRDNRLGLETTAFHLPTTKASRAGEDTFWARKDGLSDPESALQNHFSVNGPLPKEHLFSYTDP
ncbi:hypothetical protein BDZ97DRAFT_1616234, partial [Flammula alnicola]